MLNLKLLSLASPVAAVLAAVSVRAAEPFPAGYTLNPRCMKVFGLAALKSCQLNRRNELHVFAKGGHGFGMRRRGNDVDGWEALAAKWLGRTVLSTGVGGAKQK